MSFEYIHLGDNEKNVLMHLTNNNFYFLGKGLDYNGFDYLYVKLKYAFNIIKHRQIIKRQTLINDKLRKINQHKNLPKLYFN